MDILQWSKPKMPGVIECRTNTCGCKRISCSPIRPYVHINTCHYHLLESRLIVSRLTSRLTFDLESLLPVWTVNVKAQDTLTIDSTYHSRNSSSLSRGNCFLFRSCLLVFFSFHRRASSCLERSTDQLGQLPLQLGLRDHPYVSVAPQF